MSQTEIKAISNKFTRNIMVIQGVSFIVLIGMVGFATYIFKAELADQIARTVGGQFKRGAMREVLHTLSDSKTNDFIAVDLYNSQNELQLTFPTQFRREVSAPERLWRQIGHTSYSKKIFFDPEQTKVAATVTFTFGIFRLFPMAVIIFILGLLATYPFVRRYKSLLLKSIEKEGVKRQTEAITELARQVRHDYKSPLSAIGSVIERAKGLRENEKKTLSIAYNKMIAMLGDLSHENIQEVLKGGIKKKEAKSLTHIFSVVQSVVEEKRARLGYEATKTIQLECAEDDKRAYILIDDTELHRVISNIVENALDALFDKGQIKVYLKINGTNLEVEIADSGKGIPKDLIKRVTEKGFSFDKIGGEGIGLYSAQQKVKLWGGTLELKSIEGEGTVVKICLPKAVKPSWACSKLDFTGIEDVVVLDDDQSIHDYWREHLPKGLNLTVLSDGQELLAQIENWPEKTLFLLDYELKGQAINGLDIAQAVQYPRGRYLISGSFQNPHVQRVCKSLNIQLIPKTVL